jgi:hypothetical protein
VKNIPTTLGIALVCLLISSLVALAADWDLVFEDDFEREDVGEDYVFRGRDEVTMRIEDGALLFTGAGAVVLIDRPFAMDVRLEFDSWAWADAAPCDLSATLNANRDRGYTYFLSFGGHLNRINQLAGPGVRVWNENPQKRIEPGKVHHMIAEREGQRISYKVDGVTILEDSSPNLVGGPAFNRVGFVTWAGMWVDNVKVYERSTPHPDTRKYLTDLPGLPLQRDKITVYAREGVEAPNLDEALDALNRRDFETAKELFGQMDDATLRLAGLAHILGDINYFEKPVYGNRGTTVDFGEVGEFAELWRKEAADHPENQTLQDYLTAVESFGKLVFQRASGFEARMLVDLGPENNPFYYKAKLFLGRYTFYNGAEGGSRKLQQQGLDMMAELQEIWPENRVLREYLGPPVPWGDEYLADTEHHPEWAAYLREAYARQVAILTEFCRSRQLPDGQFGGGWGDDVEMLRSWVSVAAISSAAEGVRHGIDRLAEGIWTHVTVNGFSDFPGDVEHSAEPSADTFPTQLLLRHGDPLYHEWNLTSCRTMLDVMMGIDDNGFHRFRSVNMGSSGVRTNIESGGDTGYHARAMKHFYWLAWYGNEEAKDVYLDWADGWRHTVMLDNPDKPEGVTPGTIWYPSGDYNPPNGEPWCSEKAFNLYGTTGLADMVHDTFLAAYSLSGDRKFLRPFQRMMDYSTWGPLIRGETTPPSREWFYATQLHLSTARATALYAMLTGERVYDEYTKRFGSAPMRYQIDHDMGPYLASCKRAAQSLRHNLWRLTTETMATDRYWIPATDEVWGAYSGAIQGTRDARVPMMAVTYETPTTDFAALVVENHPARVRLWFYSFWYEPTEVGLKLWQLVPGEYILNRGKIEPGEREFQKRYGWGEPERVTVLRKGDVVPVTVPPQVEYCIDLRLDRELPVPEKAADLAIHRRDVTMTEGGVETVITNLGSAAAKHFSVRLERKDRDLWMTVDSKRIERLSQPVGFKLFKETVNFEIPGAVRDAPLRIVLDPEDELFELCETNNVAQVNGAAE